MAKKTIQRQLEHHELMDWVEQGATPEEVEERAAHANAGYPVIVTEEVEAEKGYDYERSLEIVNTPGLLTLPKWCWYNSVNALRACKKQLKNAMYVEGFIEFIPGLYLEHGWLELPDGTIIDTTRAFLECYYGHEPDNRTYYPVLEFTLKDLKGVRAEQLPLGMIELNIWQFEHLPEQIQQKFLRGQSLEDYLTKVREQVRL